MTPPTQVSQQTQPILDRDVPPGRLARTLLSRNFGLLWFGEGISLLGSSTSKVLIPLLAVTGFRAGALWLGALTAAAWLPWLVLGLPAGAWVDRSRPRTVMIIADLVSAVALLSVPVAWWLGSLGLTQLLIVALIGGVAAVFFQASYVRLLPEVVSPAQLGPANARLFGTESLGQIAGPGLGGLLAQAVPAAVGVLADAASFLVSALCLWRIKPRPVAAGDGRARPAEPSRDGLLSEIRQGIRLVSRDANLRVLTLLGGASNFGLTGYQALLVLYLIRRLGLNPGTVGVVLMLGSAGGLIGASLANRLAARIGSGRASTVLLIAGGPSALLIGLPTTSGQSYLTVAGLVLVGAAVVAGNVIRGAWRQRYVPAAVLGRVVSSSSVINYGTMPLAAITAGWLGASLGVRATVLIMAGVHACACCAILLTRLGRLHELPEPVASFAG